jgi:hypothetical protein
METYATEKRHLYQTRRSYNAEVRILHTRDYKDISSHGGWNTVQTKWDCALTSFVFKVKLSVDGDTAAKMKPTQPN